MKALQAGAAFTFDYEITSTADSPALYTILQKTGSTKGTVNGLYAPDALQLSISAPDAVIPAGPLTRVYISSSETLYDVGQLYKNIRSSITDSYPLASLLLPDGSLIYLLFCTSKWGWGFKNYQAEANKGGGLKVPDWVRVYLSYILPLLLLVLIVQGLIG